MKFTTAMKSLAAAAAVSAGALTMSGPTHALGSDIAGDRVSWFSHLPCSDGGGVSVSARMQYRTPSTAYYRMRVSLYTSSDGLLLHGPLRDSAYVAGNVWLQYGSWNTSHGYTGNAEVVAFIHRWNGSAWALVARETVACL